MSPTSTRRARAVVIREPGGLDVLELREVEVPEPGLGEACVQVAAAGVNRADVLQRRGLYPAPSGAPKDIPGLEYAGTVVAVGDGVTAVEVGARVMGIVGGGALCTHVVVHERELIPVPPGLSLREAAAIPEVFLTAYDALFLQAQIHMGQVVLVHAAGSGVGTAAIQLALLAGARPVGTSRTVEKLRRARDIGLADAIHTIDGAFADELHRLTDGHLADVVLDTVGGAYLAEDLRAVAKQGLVVLVGLVGGASATLPLSPLLTKRVRVHGTVLRSRSHEEKAALARAFEREVVPLLADGRLRPVVDAVLPVGEVREAHRRLEANATFGKLVLEWPDAGAGARG